tara:strand:+ start:6395 stop:7579 length:1185 start_codon:yes stop_codon:yes gene_type:complete
MALYNPLAFTRPTNSGTAGLQLLGNALDQRRQRGDLRASEDKKLNAFKRLQGLEQLGQYQPDELENPEVQAQMNQARMESLGSPQAYYADQMKQQQMQAKGEYQQQLIESRNRERELSKDPRVVALRETQDRTYLEAQNVLSKAVATSDPKERASLRLEHQELLRENLGADRQLTSFGLPSHAKNRMTSWVKGLGGMAKQLGAEDMAQAELAGKKASTTLKEEEVKNIAMDRALQAESLKQSKERTADLKTGKVSEREASALVKELMRQEKLISKASTGDVWQNAFTFGKIPTAMSTAGSNFQEAILRDKSGAAISLQEEVQEFGRYMPSITDSDEVRAEKARTRAGLIRRVIAGAGKAYKGGEYKSPYSFKGSSSESAKSKVRVFDPTTGTFN